MVEMSNKPSTMETNRPASFKNWDENLQNDFNQVLRWFDQASTKERERFENDTESSTPERQAWLRIMKA